MSQTIGRYQIQERIGQGGMGVVYKAYDPVLQRLIALKILSGIALEDHDARERLMREARAAGQLSHKNIIVIHDLGEDQGQPYLAMEYLTGASLEVHLRRGPLPLERSIEIAIELCRGLEFAHQHGIVHRDIKPANLFLTDAGELKILDFGLVRIGNSSLTRSQSVMGTVNYMAPEQVRGERVDHRADIFAAGAVLYELLARRKAYDGDSFAATMFRIVHESPDPLDRHCPGLARPLVSVVERALAKDPGHRYQSAGDMRLDLIAARDPHAVFAPRAAEASDLPTVIHAPAVATQVPSAAAPVSTPAPLTAQSVAWSPRRIRSTAIIGVVLTAAFAGTLFWVPREERPATTVADDSAGQPNEAGPVGASPPAASPGPSPAASSQAPSVDTSVPEPPVTPPNRPVVPAPQPPSAPSQPAQGPTAADRRAVASAIAALEQARAAADAADAPNLASGPYRAAVTLENEARGLAGGARVSDALRRFVEAESRFRGAAIEARAEARLRAAEAIPPPAPRATPPPPRPEPQVADARPPVPSTPPPAAPPVVSAPPTAPPVSVAPSAAPPADTATPRAVVNAEQQVRQVVADYVNALEARNIAMLKHVWPALGGAQERAIRNEFTNSRSVQVQFSDPDVDVHGDTATFTGVRNYSLVTADNQRLSTVTRTTISLRRNGDGWHIERVAHQSR